MVYIPWILVSTFATFFRDGIPFYYDAIKWVYHETKNWTDKYRYLVLKGLEAPYRPVRVSVTVLFSPEVFYQAGLNNEVILQFIATYAIKVSSFWYDDFYKTIWVIFKHCELQHEFQEKEKYKVRTRCNIFEYSRLRQLLARPPAVSSLRSLAPPPLASLAHPHHRSLRSPLPLPNRSRMQNVPDLQ